MKISTKLLMLLVAAVMPLITMAAGKKPREAVVEGYALYPVSSGQTFESAETAAIELAQQNAIEKEFPRVVVDNTTQTTVMTGDKTTDDFVAVSNSQLKAEWIETIGTPDVKFSSRNDGMHVVEVTIKGRIREIVSNKVDIEWQVLCNGIEPRHARTEFSEGDDMFLSFTSPVQGYLAIYMVDYIADVAFCLLPYAGSPDAVQEIEPHKRYLFFSRDHDNRPYVDEYNLTVSGPQERDDIVVLFSPNKFSKSKGEQTGALLPRELPRSEFNKWIAKLRSRDTDMQVEPRPITIRQR